MSRFLRFVVERHLEGRDQELKESLIAIEVFGRLPGYDSKQDPIVRTEASRLRARLNEYYLVQGKDDPVVIELPKGGYVPVVRSTERRDKPADPEGSKRSTWWVSVGAALALLVVAVAAIGWWRFRPQNAPISIAVLPLLNLNQDPAYDYFADGLTGELIRNLSIIDGLTVRSETSPLLSKASHRKRVTPGDNWRRTTSWKVRCCGQGSSCGLMWTWFGPATIFPCGRAAMTGSLRMFSRSRTKFRVL